MSGRDGNNSPTYRVELSIEKNVVVDQRFRLQTSQRRFASEHPENGYRFIREGGVDPDWAMQFSAQWAAIREQDLRRVT